MAYLSTIAADVGAEVVPDAQAPTPVVVRHWFNPNLVTAGRARPDLSLRLFSALITSLSIARERELSGPSDQLLVSPTRRARDHHFQITAGTATGTALGLFMISAGVFLFWHPVYGLVCTPLASPGALFIALGGRHRSDDFRGQHDAAAGHPGAFAVGVPAVLGCQALRRLWKTCLSSQMAGFRPFR